MKPVITAYLFIFPLLGLVLTLLPATVDAQWNTLPPLQMDEVTRIKPAVQEEDVFPDATEDGEAGAEQQERRQFTAVEAGYYFRDYSFATGGQGTYQSFFFGEQDFFGFSIRLDFLRQFGASAAAYQFAGYYYFSPKLRAGIWIRFSPQKLTLARQEYKPFIELGLLDNKLVANLQYSFREYRQADLHDMQLDLRIYPFRWITINPRYIFNVTQQGINSKSLINQSAEIKISAHPIDMITLFAKYAFTQQDFEAGAPNPYPSFHAQDFGGGIILKLGVGPAIFFDFTHENRNNGQSYQLYNTGTTFAF